jgi:hypothetical protein
MASGSASEGRTACRRRDRNVRRAQGLCARFCLRRRIQPERQGAGTGTNGVLTIAIDPSRLIGREWLGEEIAAMTAYIATIAERARRAGVTLLPTA